MRFRANLIALAVIAFAGLLIRPAFQALSPRSETRWTMLNVTPANAQADCHLLTLPGNIHVLIDPAEAGDAPGSVLKQLRTLGVSSLELVIVSHFHYDHYQRLLDIADSGIPIKRVAVNVPDKAAADREKPWGCNWDHVQWTLAELRERNIPYFTPEIGERFLETNAPDGSVVAIDAVCLYDGLNTPVGPTDVNDTSIIVRVSHGPTRALFTGDLNLPLGTYLAGSDFDLRADVLKVPHHGTEGVAPNEFFLRVAPKIALVPSPEKLWLSARSERVRKHFETENIPVYVSGINGMVTVTMTARGVTVSTER